MEQTDADIYDVLHRELRFTDAEIKKLTTLQVNLYIQRNNEPRFKNEVDSEIQRINERNKAKKSGRH